MGGMPLAVMQEDFLVYNFFVCVPYLATITNYYRRHGFEFDCNQEATLVRGAKPLIDFNLSSIWWWLLDMQMSNSNDGNKCEWIDVSGGSKIFLGGGANPH